MTAPAEAPPITSAPVFPLTEPVEMAELTDSELDAVAGGAPTTLSGTISVNPYI